MRHRLLFATIFLVVFSIACTKEEHGLEASDLVGIWAPIDEEEISFYWEFKSDGTVNYYELKVPLESDEFVYSFDYELARFSEGVLYAPSSNSDWVVKKSGIYVIDNDQLFYMGKNAGKVIIVNDDTLIFQSSILHEGTVRRVTRFDIYDSARLVSSIDKIKGTKWRIALVRYWFDGHIISSVLTSKPYDNYEGVVQLFFDSDSVDYVVYDEGDYDTYSLPYHINNESQSIFIGEKDDSVVFPIYKFTNDKLEFESNDGIYGIYTDLDDFLANNYHGYNNIDVNTIRESVFAQFMGKTVYFATAPWTGVLYFCYYNQEGDRVFCDIPEGISWREYFDDSGEYLSLIQPPPFDLFFDSCHLCFLAE